MSQSRTVRVVAALLLGTASGACGTEDSSHEGDGASSTAATDPGGRKVAFYKSPMDPAFISTKPGKDGMGMDLVAVYEGDPAADLDVIDIKGATLQRMGVRTEPVRRDLLTRIVRAVGRVDFDEKRVAVVNMKFDGWIEKLHVSETGQKVKEGQALFSVYSPELLASQKEYLQILKGAATGPHSAHLRRAARDRLLQFDVPRSFVDHLERTRTPTRRVTVRSPAGGYVVHKRALEGTFVKKGASLFTIADLGALWVLADVFEYDAPWVYEGQKATIELSYLPGNAQEATVDYVYPTLNERSRTLQVRLALPNPRVALKPGMFATVRIHAHPVGETLVVPTEAVIHSGERHVVFVRRGDGMFEGRDVKLGVYGDTAYQVLGGLAEGELVVTSGQFLIDSESRLKEAVKKMLGSNLGPADGEPDAGQTDTPRQPAEQAAHVDHGDDEARAPDDTEDHAEMAATKPAKPKPAKSKESAKPMKDMKGMQHPPSSTQGGSHAGQGH